jgi:hypothetical protein
MWDVGEIISTPSPTGYTAQDFLDGTAPVGNDLATALGLTKRDGFHADCSYFVETSNDGSGYCLEGVPGSQVDLRVIALGLQGHRVTESEPENIKRSPDQPSSAVPGTSATPSG